MAETLGWLRDARNRAYVGIEQGIPGEGSSPWPEGGNHGLAREFARNADRGVPMPLANLACDLVVPDHEESLHDDCQCNAMKSSYRTDNRRYHK